MLDPLESGKINIGDVLGNLPEKPTGDIGIKDLRLERISDRLGSINNSKKEFILAEEAYGIYLSRFTDKPIFLTPQTIEALLEGIQKASEKDRFNNMEFNFLLATIAELRVATSGQDISIPIKRSIIDQAYSELKQNTETPIRQLDYVVIPLLLLGEKDVLSLFTQDRKEEVKKEQRKWVNRYKLGQQEVAVYALNEACLYRLAFPEDEQLLTPEDPLFRTIVENYNRETNLIQFTEGLFSMTVLAAKDVKIDKTGVHLNFTRPSPISTPRPLERKF